MTPLARRLEPWRDAALLALWNHGVLLAVALADPSLPWLLLAAVPLGLGFTTATLTVVHDAGHGRFAPRALWPNVVATQVAAPVGICVAHWGLKHRVHHKLTQVYPLDDATRSSAMVRLHPGAKRYAAHRWQHVYAWVLYGLAWAGELRSQLTWVRTGRLAGTESPPRAARVRAFVLEKLLWAAVLTPYALLLGVPRLALLLVTALSLASVGSAVVLVVGHIQTGLTPTDVAPRGREWQAHLVRTTADFRTGRGPLDKAAWWLTGAMTHHLAHHLRPVAARGELAALTESVVPRVAAEAGQQVVSFRSLAEAVRGHHRRLKALGRYDVLPSDAPPPPAAAEAPPAPERELVGAGSR